MKRIYLILLVFSLCVFSCGEEDAVVPDDNKTEQPDDGDDEKEDPDEQEKPEKPENPDDPEEPVDSDPDVPEEPAVDIVFAVSTDAVIFDSGSAVGTDVDITAPSGYWRVEKSDDWFGATPEQGSGDGTLTVTATASDDIREGEIIVSLFDDAASSEPVARRIVRVFQDNGTQSAAPSFEVINTTELLNGVATTLQFSPQGETRVIDCRVEDAQGWHLFADKRNIADGRFTIDISGGRVYVTARPNTTGEDIDYVSFYLYLAATPDGARKMPVTVRIMQLGSRYSSMRGLIHANGGELSAVHEAIIKGRSVDAMKLGSGQYTGHYTSDALGIEGNRELVMYALGWKEADHNAATLYLRVDGGGSISPSSVALTVNDGATGMAPFNLVPSADDRYVFELRDMTPSSTISVSTSPDFTKKSDKKTGRALLYGVQLK